MLFEVDFAIKINNCFQTVHKAFIDAESVSDCMYQAEEEIEQLPVNKSNQIHIFIEA
ncbi:hypothetical protein M3204_03620 [Mesobacillus subterraneus]|uniref:hypothetical protein n=1 Tax=Mesobacillus subterraneus TaxID=285983 RepID=UPI00203AF2B0|nr:hypothetical protein [Mesobacillus subterraneus]MCM3663476.1 hypothetical protein [Mesobacillus subterraneus]MCM3683246.1 hypothetical protein [Mesobacillus subterraneus]